MSKKYQDGFFHICSAFLEMHESISVRSLAPFLEIPRSTLQDGLKRVNHLDTTDMSEVASLNILNIANAYFNDKIKTISSLMTDAQILDLYQLEVSDTQYDDEIEELDDFEDDFDDLLDDVKPTTKEKSLSDLGVIPDIDSKLSDKMLDEREEMLTEAKRGGFTDINDYVIRLARQKQRMQDISREERKVMREAMRSVNLLEELQSELLTVLKEHNVSYTQKERTVNPKTDAQPIGVIQLSDLHLGELVNETISNRFDMDVASKRLHKLLERSIARFKAEGVRSVAVFMTGDMINSTRRISEITAYAGPRVRVVFHAYLLLGQFLESLNEYFDVTVAHVVGNESRLSEYFDTTNFLASDNFDLMLFEMLKQSHERDDLVFVDSGDNPMEQVIEVNGVNFLLVHGNGHSGIAATSKIENEVQKIKARYADQNIKIGYVLCGHIHSTYIANGFARSASLVGSNAYAERQLNFTSRASQNIFVVHGDGTVEGTMVDLQEYQGYSGLDYDNTVMTHETTTCNAPVIHRMK